MLSHLSHHRTAFTVSEYPLTLTLALAGIHLGFIDIHLGGRQGILGNHSSHCRHCWAWGKPKPAYVTMELPIMYPGVVTSVGY